MESISLTDPLTGGRRCESVNAERGLGRNGNGDRLVLVGAGLEAPLANRVDRLLVEALFETAGHNDVSGCAVRKNGEVSTTVPLIFFLRPHSEY